MKIYSTAKFGVPHHQDFRVKMSSVTAARRASETAHSSALDGARIVLVAVDASAHSRTAFECKYSFKDKDSR